ncbi:UNVERIFIED_CONTAM: DNA-binding MurR/RpiR family transcriptional regulator [Brevibacillus sp. OAP136]
MKANVKERIRTHFAGLTASQRMISRFVLDKPNLIAVHTAKKIGELTNTSESTVIRFSYALGYSGYGEMQEEIRRALLISDQLRGPIEKHQEASGERVTSENFVQQALETDIAYIQQALANADVALFRKAIELIMSVDKIVVVGFRWCHIPATWLSNALNTLKGDTHLYQGAIGNADYLITEHSKKWLVIALSFPRHPAETIAFVKAAKTVGAQVLAITEGELSPISAEADVMLKVTTPQPVATNGMPTLFSILNALVEGVMAAGGDEITHRLQQYDEISSTFYSFTGDEEDE